MPKENAYQAGLVKRLKKEFEGCVVLKNDSATKQGIPDLLVLHHDKWAALEVKKDEHAEHQPNQDYYVEKMDEMSFAAFIHPGNETQVFEGLHSRLT
jgi:Holliday junction resolvase